MKDTFGLLFLIFILIGFAAGIMLIHDVAEPLKCPAGQKVYVHLDDPNFGKQFCK